MLVPCSEANTSSHRIQRYLYDLLTCAQDEYSDQSEKSIPFKYIHGSHEAMIFT